MRRRRLGERRRILCGMVQLVGRLIDRGHAFMRSCGGESLGDEKLKTARN
jgi:hypothetical protein